MSDPKLISPLLDGFMMGAPISSHDGVRCCPAMKADSDDKYIVKVISVPASQSKLEALLLAGAFADRESALGYFRELSDDIVAEAELLKHLGELEGFSSYDSWQIEPMEDGETGFDVYLVGPYNKTLERSLRKGPMTHLAAVNMGLDLCAALSVCRRNGYLYVDLKPENILITPDREFKISDLGFVKMSSMSYASLPDKYVSAYTAPEIKDAYSSLNDTLDTYALGLVLYQVYNNGQLPFAGRAAGEVLPPPEYADYEMAQIILKACDPDPANRWEDPMQMGQALVSYLQRNEINDDLIVPPAVILEPEAPVAEEEPYQEEEGPTTQQVIDEVNEVLASVGVTPEDPALPEQAPVLPAEEDAAAPAVTEQAPAEEAPAEIIPAEEAAPEETVSEETSAEEAPDEVIPVVFPVSDTAEDAQVSIDELLSRIEAEAAVNTQEPAEDAEEEPVDEVAQMLAQADELIAHAAPDPVVAPDPIDVPMPAPIILPKETPEAPDQSDESGDPASDEEDAAVAAVPTELGTADEADEEDEEDEPIGRPKKQKKEKKSHKGLIITLILLLLIAALAYGANYYYHNYYLQPILGITVSGEEDYMTVDINSQIADELLTVVCTDSYGNTIRQNVVNGKATFTELRPDTRYKVTVEISGRHKLIGTTTGSHTTPGQTSILNISTVTGNDDGAMILSFTVQGVDSSEWIIHCNAEGEQERTEQFKGHTVTVNGLTVGKLYTLTLEPASPLYMVGDNSAEFFVTGILSAENLTIHGFYDSALSVTWDAPPTEKGTVESWTVRCYNESGYDKTLNVTETEVLFEDADPALGYTVEVTAAGMSVSARTFVSADSVTIREVTPDTSSTGQVTVSWTFEGNDPEGGWLILYTINNESTQRVVKCDGPSGVISPAVPGTAYHITVRPAGGNTVFGGSAECTTAEAQPFSGYLIKASNIDMKMCRRPEKDNWLKEDVPEEDYVTTFAPGEKASFATVLHHEYNTSSDIIVSLFVITDADGNIVSTETQSRTWTSMWRLGFGRINVPVMPEAEGNYKLTLYFNGMLVDSQDFTIAIPEEIPEETPETPETPETTPGE